MRMWEIRENSGHYDKGYRSGMRDKSVEEVYECGYEHGYEDAMKEIEEGHESSYRKRRYR